MSTLVSGVKNNLLPDVGQFERSAGSITWRKSFIHLNSADDSALLNVRLFLEAPTPADDFVTFAAGTMDDTEDTINGRVYGIGRLFAPLNAGDSQMWVACEDLSAYAELEPFRAGDTLRIAQGTQEEWLTVTYALYEPTFLRLEFEPAIAQDYSEGDAIVASVLTQAEVRAQCSNVQLNSSAGSIDTATSGNLIAHNKGAIAQDWLLTFSDDSQFGVAGNTVGALTTPGTITADFAPINPATGTPYFTLRASAWGGTFTADETLSFHSAPAAMALWYRRQVPAGSASLANNYASLMLYGESA